MTELLKEALSVVKVGITDTQAALQPVQTTVGGVLSQPGVQSGISGAFTVADAETHGADAKHIKGDTLFHKILYSALGPSDPVESQQFGKSNDFKLQATRAQRSAGQYQKSFTTSVLREQIQHVRDAVGQNSTACENLKTICKRLETVRDVKDSMLTSQGEGLMLKILLLSGVSTSFALPVVYGGTWVALHRADKVLSNKKQEQEGVVEGTINSVSSESAATYRILIEHLAETCEKELKKLRKEKAPAGEIAKKEKEHEYFQAVQTASKRTNQAEKLSDLFNDSLMVKLYAAEKNPRILEQRKRAIDEQVESLQEQVGGQANIFHRQKKSLGFIPMGTQVEVTSSPISTVSGQKFTGSISNPRRDAGLNSKIDVLQKELVVIDNLLGNLKKDAKLKSASPISSPTSQSSTSSLGSDESLHPKARQRIFVPPKGTFSSSSLRSFSLSDSGSESPRLSTSSPLEKKQTPPKLARSHDSLGSELEYQFENLKNKKSLSDHKNRIGKSHARIDVAEMLIDSCHKSVDLCAASAKEQRVNPRVWGDLRENHRILTDYVEKIREKLKEFPTHVEDAKNKLSGAEFQDTQKRYVAVLKEYAHIQANYRSIIRAHDEIGKVLEKAPVRCAPEGWGDGHKVLATFPSHARSSSALIFEKVGMPGTKEAKEVVKREESPTQSVTRPATVSLETPKVKNTSQVKKDQSDENQDTPSVTTSYS